MSDIQILEDLIAGLQAKLDVLRTQHDLFKKAQGLLEEAEKAAAEKVAKAEIVSNAKDLIVSLRERQRKALEPVVQAIAAKMSEIMPEGAGIFEIEDKKVWIGWERPDGVRVPYSGLSGGQKVPFDIGLAYALMGKGHKILVIEAAELDPVHMQLLLNHLAANTDESLQVIMNTYQVPASVPPAWKMEVVR